MARPRNARASRGPDAGTNMTGMRTRSVLTLLLALLPLAAFAAGPGEPGGEILVYRHGKILGYDKDVGDSVKEVLIESWSCETAPSSRRSASKRTIT